MVVREVIGLTGRSVANENSLGLMMKTQFLSRRAFLHRSMLVAAAAPVAFKFPGQLLAAGSTQVRRSSNVAIVSCKSYGGAVRPALDKALDLLGGIGSLVRNKTITVKLNLTGTNFAPYLGRPVGETFMTHYDTAAALAAALFSAGAKRIRFVESTLSRASMESTLTMADWDVKALQALGKVEFENTRNLGAGKTYAHIAVPGSGLMFNSFEMNHSYADTDVMVSLAKLKNHLTAGVTLSMKNLFGLTPNSLYSGEVASEDAIDGRLLLHELLGGKNAKLPGMKVGELPSAPTSRVPRIVVDICAARPIHLAVIDGITAMSGGEGPWCSEAAPLKLTTPGVLIIGLNPVSSDAVATAVMGYEDPRAQKAKPFAACDNHLLMAEQAGLGTADLAHIDVRGLSIAKALYVYP